VTTPAPLSEADVRTIIRQVLERFPAPASSSATSSPASAASGGDGLTRPAPERTAAKAGDIPSVGAGYGVFETMDQAVDAARAAFPAYRALPIAKRTQLIDAIRKVALENAETIAKAELAETKLGRVDHKIIKLEIVARLSPGPDIIEPRVFTGDRGLTLIDYAPFGVIGAVTPSTHPVATLVCNAIAFLGGGNVGVFNPHPASQKIFAWAIQLFNKELQRLGAPPNCLTTIAKPTIETGKAMFNHPKVALILVTGGPAVVSEALAAPKRAICAGPGNPPVVVDETADIALAAREITNGAVFDNNVLCIGEKEVFVVDKVADALKRGMLGHGCVELDRRDIDRLAIEAFQLTGGIGCGKARLNRDFVGRDAHVLASSIGLRVPNTTPLLIGEVPADHPWVQNEQLMPFLPIVRVRDAKQGIEQALDAEHGYRHTASIFSRNIATMSEMAQRSEVSIFVKNGPTYAGLGQGGEGYTSFSIATPTGEGLTTARSFCRERRCALIDNFRIV